MVDVKIENPVIIVENMAKMLNNDEHFGHMLTDYIEAGEKVKMGPLDLLHYISDTLAFDKEGKPIMEKDENGKDVQALKFAYILDNLPRPQRQGEKGNTTEKITVNVRNEKTQELKPQTVSAYVYLADHLDEGIKINNALAAIAKLPKSEAKARGYGKWDARKRAFRKVVRDTGRLYFQMCDLQGCPLVQVSHALIEQMNPETNQVELVYDTSASPIKVKATRTDEAFFISVANFLRYDVKEAIEKAGEPAKLTREHLEATLKRDPGDKTKAQALNKETAYASALAEYQYLANDDNFLTEGRLVALKGKDGHYTKDADERLMAWVRLARRIDDMTGPHGSRIGALEMQERNKAA